MKRFIRRGLVFIVLLLTLAAFLYSRRSQDNPAEKDLLSASERAAVVKSLHFSRDALTPASPTVNKLRDLCKKPNVVVCVIDAARADNFGCYDYQRPTTPNIDKLAQESFLFKDHFSQYPSTVPSTVSLLSSQYPDSHGVRNPEYGRAAGSDDVQVEIQPEPAFTFPIGLEAVGWKTALFSGSRRASPSSGVGLGFQDAYYHKSMKPFVRNGEGRFAPPVLLRAFESWLQDNKNARSFVYLHFVPPHGPYEAPDRFVQPFRGKTPLNYDSTKYIPGKFLFPLAIKDKPGDPLPMPEWINKYDANLRYADWAVGEVVKLLQRNGTYDKTMLVVTSDHGEAFGEHGFVWHHGGIYNDVTHIPLLIRLPGGRDGGKQIGALTETIDLLPTVYDLLDVPFPTGEVQGRSLLPLMTGSNQHLHIISVTRSDDPPKRMIRDQRYSLLIYQNPKWRALYDTIADPGMNTNLAKQDLKNTDRLYREFLRFANAQRHPPSEFPGVTAQKTKQSSGKRTRLSNEAKEELRSLGYLK